MDTGHRDTSDREHRAVVVDERPEWLAAAARVLERLGIDVVGKETSAKAALSLIEQRRPDLLVVYIGVVSAERRAAGLECLRLARERRVPDLKAIVFGDSADRSLIDAAFAAGASAYVVRTAASEDIAAAIRQAFAQSVHFAYGP